MTTTLNGTASGNIILTNGASPCNVYWWTGTAAIIGGASFYGDILSGSSITLNSPTFGDRAFAITGAGTISNQILVVNPGGK
ncbi:MAG: ice-binding family protein [Candidatus Eremiobacteraeota bacterium]|nr:ice-binding family protein [Candidatus Eremiobacteraeota bacterium]